jgi:hypothetical protein
VLHGRPSMMLEQAVPDSVLFNFITLRDDHCRNQVSCRPVTPSV